MALFVNLPIADVERSKRFYTALGWSINESFTDENAACVVISEENYLMVLRRDFYASFLEGRKTVDLGFMYQRQFDDPDGNHFEPFWMDPVAAQSGPSAQ